MKKALPRVPGLLNQFPKDILCQVIREVLGTVLSRWALKDYGPVFPFRFDQENQRRSHMKKRISMLFALSLAFIAAIACSNVAAQNTLTGEWRASLVKDGSKLNVNFERRSDSGEGRNTFGHTFEFSELGLTKEQVQNGGPVTFRLSREAGTIDAEGTFQNGKGSGTFRFTPNPGFLSAMKSRGFDFEKNSEWKEDRPVEDRLFTAAALNVTTALADDLLSANFGKLDVGDLFKAAIFKIDSAFMREMKATGFPNLSFDDLVKARIFKIDAAFVRRANEMGFSNHSFEGLVKMSIFKVTPEFLAEVRNEGLTDLTVEDVVKLRIFKIDGEYIRKAKGEGVPLKVEDLVRHKLGVDRAPRTSRRVII